MFTNDYTAQLLNLEDVIITNVENISDEQPLDLGALVQNGRIVIVAAFDKQLQPVFTF